MGHSVLQRRATAGTSGPWRARPSCAASVVLPLAGRPLTTMKVGVLVGFAMFTLS